MTESPTPEQIAAARLEYIAAGEQARERIVEACRQRNGPAMEFLASQILNARNVSYLAIVLAQLAEMIINAEPLAPPPPIPDDSDNLPLWATSIKEQMEAAAEQKDMGTFTSIAVDGYLRALDIDAAEGRVVDLEHCINTVARLSAHYLPLVTGQMLLRLYQESHP